MLAGADMGWKRVVWAGWLAPALGGCHTPGVPGVPALAPGGLVEHTQAALEHRIRADARTAWLAVRAEHPRRCFTAEFRDGFEDGYTDHLDRGGDGTPPPTPPLRYTRHPRYFTPEGHVLLRDYFLGFKYGADVAAATGQRQYLTVPVLVPDGGGPPPELVAPVAVPTPPAPPTAPLTPPRPLPVAPPKSDRPVPLPVPPPGVMGATKFDFGPRSVTLPTETPRVGPLEIPVGVPVGLPGVRIPPPPVEVPTLPAGVPTPPITDDVPVMPPSFQLPAPLPFTRPGADAN